MALIPRLQNYFNHLGLDVRAYPTKLLRNRLKLLNNHRISLILDIGANTGQYGKLLRKIGYNGEIVSFEPITQAFQQLSQSTAKDPNWSAYNFALGDAHKNIQINVANHSPSSSLLEMHQNHYAATPEMEIVSKELVSIKRLDEVFSEDWKEKNVFVKMDVQGYELQVLKVCEDVLDHILGFQIELSLVPLYEEESNYLEIIHSLTEKGYELCSIEPGFTNNSTGRMLQFDGIFLKGC